MHTTCIRCGRDLKTRHSQKLGFGRTCYKKAVAEALTKQTKVFEEAKPTNNNAKEKPKSRKRLDQYF
jgi:hypothetical protein